MADHLTEEEQVEALKRWWNENWLSIVVPIVLIIGGYLGWNFWQSYTLGQAQAASDKYELLTQAAQGPFGEPMSAEQKLQVSQLAEGLVNDHGSSLYADMANLLLAKIHVDDNQLDAAASRLKLVADSGANESMKQLATARLARVLSAKGEHKEALALVVSASTDSYKALFAEVRGDIYAAMGLDGEAHTAYSEALTEMPSSEFNRVSFVQLKMNSVAKPALAAEVETAPETEPAVEAPVEAAEGGA